MVAWKRWGATASATTSSSPAPSPLGRSRGSRASASVCYLPGCSSPASRRPMERSLSTSGQSGSRSPPLGSNPAPGASSDWRRKPGLSSECSTVAWKRWEATTSATTSSSPAPSPLGRSRGSRASASVCCLPGCPSPASRRSTERSLSTSGQSGSRSPPLGSNPAPGASSDWRRGHLSWGGD
ncbi:hypothetical protein ZEAMMB73_Zm00001d007595 [Zea mays]|uniref:Uncharacterized protein n=1 Tax=Zea mays TaxID=4577 RepID=A0A1D6F7D7_MAIZE|nr:hypothetical protein ZEAMMB73_Zm00001d007595 [Zea mays]ONM27160.1 hypothetical protein ZEAMMB73_Zm00001d007595 [Zea mays]ONM27166.1 hypothetical protein ZEAMMB73_Zm00001d007595 [Zea mays]